MMLIIRVVFSDVKPVFQRECPDLCVGSVFPGARGVDLGSSMLRPMAEPRGLVVS